MTHESAASAPALKEIFDAARFRHVAEETAAVCPKFDAARFLEVGLAGLDDLSILQRMRRMAEGLRAGLPGTYRQCLAVLKRLAPRINAGFVTLTLPDFVALYGLDDFDVSMEALRFFTPFGSSEFGVRPFLRRDPARALPVMEAWSRDPNEHVRRLASEGSRPRLPWSFRLDEVVADPSLTATILENLKADPALYVRKSVANHLNDITKDHPEAVLDRLSSWDRSHKHTAWIARHALRTLIKQGDSRALGLIGAGEKADVRVPVFTASPGALALGGRLTLELRLVSTAAAGQRLVVDYAVHYVKKSGAASRKVFKWKELTLAAGEEVVLTRSQVVKDFTTRSHYPGKHVVEVMVNGINLAECFFELTLSPGLKVKESAAAALRQEQ